VWGAMLASCAQIPEALWPPVCAPGTPPGRISQTLFVRLVRSAIASVTGSLGLGGSSSTASVGAATSLLAPFGSSIELRDRKRRLLLQGLGWVVEQALASLADNTLTPSEASLALHATGVMFAMCVDTFCRVTGTSPRTPDWDMLWRAVPLQAAGRTIRGPEVAAAAWVSTCALFAVSGEALLCLQNEDDHAAALVASAVLTLPTLLTAVGLPAMTARVAQYIASCEGLTSVMAQAVGTPLDVVGWPQVTSTVSHLKDTLFPPSTKAAAGTTDDLEQREIPEEGADKKSTSLLAGFSTVLRRKAASSASLAPPSTEGLVLLSIGQHAVDEAARLSTSSRTLVAADLDKWLASADRTPVLVAWPPLPRLLQPLSLKLSPAAVATARAVSGETCVALVDIFVASTALSALSHVPTSVHRPLTESTDREALYGWITSACTLVLGHSLTQSSLAARPVSPEIQPLLASVIAEAASRLRCSGLWWAAPVLAQAAAENLPDVSSFIESCRSEHPDQWSRFAGGRLAAMAVSNARRAAVLATHSRTVLRSLGLVLPGRVELLRLHALVAAVEAMALAACGGDKTLAESASDGVPPEAIAAVAAAESLRLLDDARLQSMHSSPLGPTEAVLVPPDWVSPPQLAIPLAAVHALDAWVMAVAGRGRRVDSPPLTGVASPDRAVPEAAVAKKMLLSSPSIWSSLSQQLYSLVLVAAASGFSGAGDAAPSLGGGGHAISPASFLSLALTGSLGAADAAASVLEAVDSPLQQILAAQALVEAIATTGMLSLAHNDVEQSTKLRTSLPKAHPVVAAVASGSSSFASFALLNALVLSSGHSKTLASKLLARFPFSPGVALAGGMAVAADLLATTTTTTTTTTTSSSSPAALRATPSEDEATDAPPPGMVPSPPEEPATVSSLAIAGIQSQVSSIAESGCRGPPGCLAPLGGSTPAPPQSDAQRGMCNVIARLWLGSAAKCASAGAVSDAKAAITRAEAIAAAATAATHPASFSSTERQELLHLVAELPDPSSCWALVAPLGAAVLNGVSMLNSSSAALIAATADDPDELVREAAARAKGTVSTPQKLPTLARVRPVRSAEGGVAPWLSAYLLAGASETLRLTGHHSEAVAMGLKAVAADPGYPLARRAVGEAFAVQVLADSPMHGWEGVVDHGKDGKATLWASWLQWCHARAHTIDTAAAVEGCAQLTAFMSGTTVVPSRLHMALCGLQLATGRVHDAQLSLDEAVAAHRDQSGLAHALARVGMDDVVLGLHVWLGMGVGSP
jgi:hypothetical protein